MDKNIAPSEAIQLKHYVVCVSAFATVLVMASENRDQAYEYARDINSGDFEIDEMIIEEIIEPSDLKGIERARRHASVVADDK